jgi:hypothetical protein
MFVRASGPGNANHGYIQVTMLDHMIKRREYFLVSQVPHGSKQNQNIGWRCIFRALSCRASEIRHGTSPNDVSWQHSHRAINERHRLGF